MWVTASLTTVLTPTAIALGNFDGVHRGHYQVIRPVLPRFSDGDATRTPLRHQTPAVNEEVGLTLGGPPTWGAAEETSGTQATSVNPLYPTVVTFDPHPQAFFSQTDRPLLTPLAEKRLILQSLGVAQLVLLPFDHHLASLSPATFVERILIERLQARHISVGEDFRFGHHRQGTALDLRQLAAQYGVTVTIVPNQTSQDQRISSSMIRAALEAGDIAQANRLLGRPYPLWGTVVTGQQLGRTIGFPTANLRVDAAKFLPRRGVYSVWVCPTNAIGEPLSHQRCAGVMNIGHRPTVAGQQQTIEVHLLDWSGDLYGQTLRVDLEAFLRPEQRFANLADLAAQIHADCQAARAMLLGPAA
ncbi:bifunctional riboflavin kinase/FAD synthetase [Trichothermofontia sp.]